MTLDDRLAGLWTKETVFGQQIQGDDEAKEAILSDLNTIIGEDDQIPLRAISTTYIDAKNQLRQELRERFKEYCK